MAKKSGILDLSGFDTILKKIEDAGGSIDKSVDACMTKAGDILFDEQKSAMQKKKVAKDLITRMEKPSFSKNFNYSKVVVGYEKGLYDPKNLSDGYKAVFINYGTPRISPRKFIELAKKKAKPQVNKAAQETFNEILKGLKP